MKSKQLMFFLTLEDIESIFQNIEALTEVRYHRAGLLDRSDIVFCNSVFDMPDVGFTFSGDWNRIDTYLVMKKSVPIHRREVAQRSGGVKFAIDQLINPKSIELKLGGIYREKEDVIVAGRIASISKENDSVELYELFSKRIKKECKKIEAFYVGKMAEEKLKGGWRLVTNEKLSKEYDLSLS